MSVKIKLTRNAGGNKAGDTISVTPKAAANLTVSYTHLTLPTTPYV